MTEEKPATEHINVKVMDPEGGETFFKIKKTTVLKKLMDAYIQKKGLPDGKVSFIFDGQRLNINQTAESAGIEDGDMIETKMLQVGGCL